MSYFRKALLSLAALSVIGFTPALAEVVTFAAGPAYGGSALLVSANWSGKVTCRIYNNGTIAQLSNRRITANNNVTVAQNGGNLCTGTLAPRAYCHYSHVITDNLAFTCAITVDANRASITGVAEIVDSANKIVTVVPFSR